MRLAFYVSFVSLLCATGAAADLLSEFRYVSPRPHAELVAREATVILRPEKVPAEGIAAFRSVEVRGSISGLHAGEWIAAEAGETFLFHPHAPFAAGETIFVSGTLGKEGGFSFRFKISPASPDPRGIATELCEWDHCRGLSPANPPERPEAPTPRRGLSLPEFFPTVTVTVNDSPAPGYLCVGPRRTDGAPPYYATLLDNDGLPVFFREVYYEAFDFKKQPHGNVFSYLDQSQGAVFAVLDDSFDWIDAYVPEDGYSVLNGHDFQITPNGNALVIIKDFQLVDMSEVVPGGDPNATVVGLIIQEQDPSHNVVFQWRSWDHYEITDATHLDLTAPFIDYVHCNSIEWDFDGNLVISSRNMDEITKIDRQTGQIIWRMGGTNNDFTLLGDTQWFSRQHSVRRTAAGTVTVFDNGNYSTPQESRAVEYSLDETNKIATMVWEFRNDPPLYSRWGSSVQRLPNGNTLIDWTPQQTITEVRSDGTKAFEMVFDEHWSYRAFRVDWDGVAARPELWFEVTPFEATLHFAKFGDPDVAQFHIYGGATPEPTTLLGSTPGDTFVFEVDPLEMWFVRVTAEDSSGTASAYSNEVRILVPRAVSAPAVTSGGLRIELYQNRPNPFTPATSISFALPDRGLVNLSIYDVRGRLVRTLVDEVLDGGRNEVAWDGADARGRRVGSGVYFYRLSAGKQEMVRRMALVR